MLFNSYIFIFIFVPVVLFIFYFIGRTKKNMHLILWLVCASLFFYGWWRPPYLILLVTSISLNYSFGKLLLNKKSKKILCFGIIFNIGLIAYFKYAVFFVGMLEDITQTSYSTINILLPLAISFFTFQQIAYLVDVYQGKAVRTDFFAYMLFVSFFPQLIAGPIVHHKEMMSQFLSRSFGRWNVENFIVGFSIFTLGLFKKTVLADGIAEFANITFSAAEAHTHLTFFDAWFGVFSYSFQLYFDFSGYSDMAIGLGRMFGVKLPLNFASPYKSRNIIEFWRCWHMTLSRFLKDYLYIPLGGNKLGAFYRYRNLMITMILGGLWHGAGWNFVIWGFLHGVYLTINHIWVFYKVRLYSKDSQPHKYMFYVYRVLSIALTFILVSLAWVFFRASSLDSAVYILQAMMDFNYIGFDIFPNKLFILQFFGLAFITFFVPHTSEIFHKFNPVINADQQKNAALIEWKMNVYWGMMMGILFSFSVLRISGKSEFLYFQF